MVGKLVVARSTLMTSWLNPQNRSADRQLAEDVRRLKRYNMKLSPDKCVFRVPKGKLLGFIISERGIEANPEKIVAI